MLTKACCEAFDALVPNVARALSLRRPLPLVSVAVPPEAQFGASVRRPGGHPRRVLVEFNAGTLSGLHQTIEAHAVPLLSAVLGQLGEDGIDRHGLLALLYNTTLNFIQLHELFHVLGGHLDHRYECYGWAELTEARLGFSDSAEGLSESFAYALELEADNNALDVMIGHSSFAELLAQANALGLAAHADACANDLDDPARQFAFRVLVVAGWVAIALIEAARVESTQHPSPAARLLALLATAMKWYAQMTDLRLNADGSSTQSLEEAHIVGIQEFLFQVLKPVAVSLWGFPSAAVSRRLGLEGDGSAAGQLLGDVGTLLLGQPPTTPAGRQVKVIERSRIDALEALAPYRYFHVEVYP